MAFGRPLETEPKLFPETTLPGGPAPWPVPAAELSQNRTWPAALPRQPVSPAGRQGDRHATHPAARCAAAGNERIPCIWCTGGLPLAIVTALTILICTHNRADLLERVLASLNAARRPVMPVQIMVAANACTDDTTARMVAYQAQQGDKCLLPL